MIAIVKLEVIDLEDDKTRWVAMPAEWLVRAGLDETQFVEHLGACGLEPASFDELVQQAHRQYRDDPEGYVFQHLLADKLTKSED